MILSDALILHVSQLRTQQVMTSQMKSHIEYLMQTLQSFTDFVVNIYEKFSLNDGFEYDLMMIPKWLTFFGPPCIVIQRKFKTKLQYSIASFAPRKQSSLVGGFPYDLLIIRYGLLFGPPCTMSKTSQLRSEGYSCEDCDNLRPTKKSALLRKQYVGLC